jgi:hypothetical protein
MAAAKQRAQRPTVDAGKKKQKQVVHREGLPPRATPSPPITAGHHSVASLHATNMFGQGAPLQYGESFMDLLNETTVNLDDAPLQYGDEADEVEEDDDAQPDLEEVEEEVFDKTTSKTTRKKRAVNYTEMKDGSRMRALICATVFRTVNLVAFYSHC